VDYDGRVRSVASSPSTQINFDAADKIANATPNGAVSRSVEVIRGTGAGQIIPIATVAGASGSKVGTVPAGTTISPALATDSYYAWNTGGSIGSASGGLELGSGTVTGTPRPQFVQVTGAGLVAVSGIYKTRSLYVTSGSLPTYLTDPCSGHSVDGTGDTAVHTFTFQARQLVLAAGDKVSIVA
jgi:hypothetical protein